MATVPPLDDSGSHDDVAEIARQASATVLERIAESVTSANPAYETTTSTQQVGHSGKTTTDIVEASTAAITPAIHGIANLSLESPMDTGVSGSQFHNFQPPVDNPDDSDDSEGEDEDEEQDSADGSQDPSNYTRVKDTISDVLLDNPGVLSAALNAHGAFHIHELQQLRRQATDAIGKIDESLAKNNIRDMLMRVATSPDVLEAVAETLSKSPAFKTRIKTISLAISQHQANQQGLIAYNHLKDDTTTLRKIADLVAANDEVRRRLFENTTTSTARDGDCELIPERPPNPTRAPDTFYATPATIVAAPTQPAPTKRNEHDNAPSSRTKKSKRDRSRSESPRRSRRKGRSRSRYRHKSKTPERRPPSPSDSSSSSSRSSSRSTSISSNCREAQLLSTRPFSVDIRQ